MEPWQILCFSSKFCTWVLAFTGRHTCLQQFLLWCISIPIITSFLHLLIGRAVFSHLFIQLFIYVIMDVRAAYYIPFVIIQSIVTDFVAQLVSVLDIGSSFGLPTVTLWQAPILFWALLYFLVPQDAPVSSYVFSAPPLESTTSTRTFVRKWHLETKLRALGMFTITGISLIPDSISGPCFYQHHAVLINVT